MKTIAKIILAGFLTFAGANRVQSGIIPQQQIYNAGSLEAGAVTYALSNCKKTDMKAEFPTGMNIYEQGMLKYNLDYSPEFQVEAWDNCKDGVADEFYCDANGVAVRTWINCPTGKCSGGGACEREPRGMSCSNNLECKSLVCLPRGVCF